MDAFLQIEAISNKTARPLHPLNRDGDPGCFVSERFRLLIFRSIVSPLSAHSPMRARL